MGALAEITLCSMCSQSPLVEVFKKKCGAIYIAQSMIALFEMGKIDIVREKINLGILSKCSWYEYFQSGFVSEISHILLSL